MNILEKRVQKVIDYLNSERGKKNWLLNIERGYNYYKNLFAAIQTSTHLIKYERIIEVYDAVTLRLDEDKAA